MSSRARVAILMGSKNDWDVMRAAEETLESLDIGCDARVISAHRTPARLTEFLATAEEEGIEVIIAGAFGTYIDVGSAITIGMLPDLPVDRFRQVGNAAGRGATLALVSRAMRREAHAMARKVGYIELASSPDFMNTYTQSMYLGPYRAEED